MAMEYADVGVGRDDCELPEVIAEVRNARVGLREFDGADCNTWLRDSERKLADSGVPRARWAQYAKSACVGVAELFVAAQRDWAHVTWELFTAQMRIQFHPPDTANALARRRLRQLKLTSMSDAGLFAFGRAFRDNSLATTMGDAELYDIFCELLPDDLHDFLRLHNATIQRWDLGLLALQRYLLARANTRPPVVSVLRQGEPCRNCVQSGYPDDTRVVAQLAGSDVEMRDSSSSERARRQWSRSPPARSRTPSPRQNLVARQYPRAPRPSRSPPSPRTSSHMHSGCYCPRHCPTCQSPPQERQSRSAASSNGSEASRDGRRRLSTAGRHTRF
jgi:hypothetical protein